MKFSFPIIKINQTGYILNSSLTNSIEKENLIIDYEIVENTLPLFATIKNIFSKPEPKTKKQQYFVINSNIFDNLLNNIFSHIKKILDVTIENEVKNKLDLEMKNLNKLISKRVSDLEKEIEEKKVSIKNKISICEDRFNILELLKIINDRVKQRIEKCSFVLKEENGK